MVVIYLHGFASAPESSKARFFAGQLAASGISFLCPDLNKPEFATLTVSRMLRQLDGHITALPPGEVVLIGSSLGGFVAVEAAARSGQRDRPISKLVLLAPAVELEWDRWAEVGPGGIEGWRTAGDIEIYHYAQQGTRRLNFGFYEDARHYDPASRRLAMPMLIFQGRRDESVSPAIVQRFADAQPSATLHMLDDTHQLKDSLPFIWLETARFLSPKKRT